MKKFLAVSLAAGLSTFAWAGGGSSGGGNQGGGQDCDHPDSCGYPKKVDEKAANQKPGVVFTENDAIPTAGLTTSADLNPNNFAAWYTEEFALIVGVGQVDTVSNSGKVTAGPLFSPAPAVGAPPFLGLFGTTPVDYGNDASGRPARPVVYLTDITTNATLTTGDWQNGGKPNNPTGIYGTGKAAVNDQIGTPNPATSLVGVKDPTANHLTITGGDVQTPLGTFPAGFHDQGFSSEVAWALSSLKDSAANVALIDTHKYRAQVILHQGDTSSDNWWGGSWFGGWGGGDHKSIGDVIQAGEYCTTFTYSAPATGCSATQAFYTTGSPGNNPPTLTYFTVSLTGPTGACVCPSTIPTSFAGSAPMTVPAGSDPSAPTLTLSCGAQG